ncbi:type II toxin-antitoxin system prevent-host-death family antitoxin [Zavarzinia compransoris]|uniref:type II toxin-antitoxin system prevent-host-death family antitoxin n=1 Tax=Zavarzinia marina TaxID=2911065 RepID=UPI001F23AC15|nr:type II toxin-antitoxin system prevent-host-death family antitoxin [Zavarzinia marina]MCF4165463.1 type II toxin-antitoxin system prevent-host-death family antitoxin [Zavarzinia marina]
MNDRPWTVSEAKAHLSEILRRARTEGPQRIGARETFVVVPEAEWRRHVEPRLPLGRWLLENMPTGDEVPLPDRRDPERPLPFAEPEKA